MVVYQIIYLVIAICGMFLLPYLDYKDHDFNQTTYKDFLKYVQFSSYLWYFIGGIMWPLTIIIEIIPYFIRRREQ